MKQKIVNILLLFSLFFNAVHAYVIAFEEHCEHDSPIEYLQEISHSNDCGDICDIHHLFHWSAIIVSASSLIESGLRPQPPISYKYLHFTHIAHKDTKPPIA